MECEDEEQESERAQTVSDRGQPSRREREEHEAAHARYMSWRIGCVRGRGTATKHFRQPSAHDKSMHTCVMDDSRHKAISRKEHCWSQRKSRKGQSARSWLQQTCANALVDITCMSGQHEIQESSRQQSSGSKDQEQESQQQNGAVGKIAWMVHRDKNLWNKLEPLHQYGVFARILPRTRKFVVLTPEGAE